MEKDRVSMQSIIELHRTVSKKIKNYEALTDEYMPIEVSNELRYAFRALIDHLDDTVKDKNYDLVRTHYALRCASFDLVDGLIITVYEYSNELLRDYPIETMNTIKNIMEINEYVHELNETIAESRGGSKDDKVLCYDKLQKNEFETLSSYYKTLKFAEPTIKKIFNETKAKENKILTEAKKEAEKGHLIGISGIAIGIVIAIITLMIG